MDKKDKKASSIDKSGVRIISLEASEIYRRIYDNGEEVGYVLPAKKSKAYFALFKNVLDYSLDLIELEDAYEKKCRREFSFEDEHKNQYTLAVINLKFKSVFKNKKLIFVWRSNNIRFVTIHKRRQHIFSCKRKCVKF